MSGWYTPMPQDSHIRLYTLMPEYRPARWYTPMATDSTAQAQTHPVATRSNFFPRTCHMWTSLPLTQISDEWTVKLLTVAIGTHLKMNDLGDVKDHMLAMQQRGFKYKVFGNVTPQQVLSDTADQLPDGIPRPYTMRTIVMPDTMFGAGMVRFCFYFDR